MGCCGGQNRGHEHENKEMQKEMNKEACCEVCKDILQEVKSLHKRLNAIESLQKEIDQIFV